MNCASLLTYLGRDLLVEDEDRPGAVLLSFLLLCAFPPEEQRALESVFGDQNLNDNKIFLTHCTLGVQGVPSGRELGWVELNLRSSLSWLAIQWIATAQGGWWNFPNPCQQKPVRDQMGHPVQVRA